MHRDIIVNNLLLGQLYDLNNIDGVNFPSPKEMPFQFGYGKILSKKVLVPHIHKRVLREINSTSEFLFVLSGELIVDIYNENEEFVEEISITQNMGLLQFFGGHKITIKANTVYFELKQGPYFGRDFDKYEIK
jgi:hypothetical protein